MMLKRRAKLKPEQLKSEQLKSEQGRLGGLVEKLADPIVAKTQVEALKNKILNSLDQDPRALNRAVAVITSWINKRPGKK